MNFKRLVATTLVAFAGLAVLAPTVAEAAPHRPGARHKVCHWDKHHHHRTCRWVR